MTWQRILIDGRLQLRFVPERQVQLPVFQFAQQRATCEACGHVLRVSSMSRDVELLCNQGGGRRGCSFLRLAGQACGPEARHFTPGGTDAL